MRWLAALALLSLFGAAARADGAGAILLLERGGADERALLDALRIYTRDLGCRVIALQHPPESRLPEEIALATERGHDEGASLVVWIAADEGALTLFALRTAGSEPRLQATPIGNDNREVSARTLALKIRALYARSGTERATGWTPIAVAPPPALPLPAPPTRAPQKTRIDDDASASAETIAPPATTPPPPSRRALPTAADLAASPFAPFSAGRRAGLEVGASLGFDSPIDSAALRYGLLLRVAIIPAPTVALELDGALTTHPSGTAGAGGVDSYSFYEVPAGLSATWRWQHGRFGVAIGPRAALHAFHVAGSAPEGRGLAPKWLYCFGAGGSVEGRYALTNQLAISLGAGAEVLAPHRALSLDGTQIADLGAVQFTAAAGFVFRAY